MEKQIIDPFECVTMRLVKSEDLNHHGTLYAGRTAEWFVESGFIAASSILNPKNIVCLKIHGMHFTEATKPGEVLKFVSRIAYTGKSSIVVYIDVTKNKAKAPFVTGFITYIHVDEFTQPAPHFVTINPTTKFEKKIYDEASQINKKPV